MSLTSGAAQDFEQAGEKLADHVQPGLLAVVAAIFAEIRKTRVTITIDIGQSPPTV